MRRRTLLAALGAGTSLVAGCPSVTDRPGTTPNETPDDPATDTPAGSPPGEDGPDFPDDPFAASIVDLETGPRTYALASAGYRSDGGAEVRIKFDGTATADHPLRVVAELTNANDFADTVRLDWLPPFGRLTSDKLRLPWGDLADSTYRTDLVFAPTPNHDLVDDPPAVERASDGYWRLAGEVSPWLPETVRLDPGESVVGEYALVGRSEGVGEGRPTGVYEFSRADDPPLAVAVWNTDEPGPAEQSRFAGESVPPLAGSAAGIPEDRPVAWYHGADATTPSYVRPATERTTLPAEVSFTFVNHDRESTSCGHWNLYKLDGGEWFHLGPYVQTADCRVVRPGGWKTWTLEAFHGPGFGSSDPDVLSAGPGFDYLGGGRYAAVAGYGHATDASAALVEFDADPVSVVPTDDAAGERSGSTVTVTTGRWEDGEDPPSAVLSVTRASASNSGDAKRIIPEQVMRPRNRGLRNSLAFFESGVEKVVLRTDERVVEGVVGYESDSVRFVFEGEVYVAEVEPGQE